MGPKVGHRLTSRAGPITVIVADLVTLPSDSNAELPDCIGNMKQTDT